MTIRKLVAVAVACISCSSLHAQQASNSTNSNEEAMNTYLNEVCDRLFAAEDTGQSSSSSSSSNPNSDSAPMSTRVGIQALDVTQSDLLVRCRNLRAAEGQGDPALLSQINAAENLEAAKLDTLLFLQINTDTLLERLRVLRTARKGVNTAALPARSGYASSYRAPALGGGASADQASANPELLDNRLGTWLRVNAVQGDKDPTALTGAFDNRQQTYTAGADYRLERVLLGGSLGWRSSKFDYGAARGAMDSDALIGSLYGSALLYRDLYLDVVANYADHDYDTRRHILYDEFGAPIDRTALGHADGTTWSSGASLGYDFAHGGLNVTPSLTYYYIKATVKPFAEQGADGLNLAFSEQRYTSSSLRLGLAMSQAVNLSWGVLLPHLRAEYIRESRDALDTFGVRFVSDPDATATTPVNVEALDSNYYRVAVGVSAQFRGDVSAYLDYQQLAGFEALSYRSTTLGVRVQF